MHDQAIAIAVKSLLEIRRTGEALESFPAGAEPATLTDAYQIQDSLIAALNQPAIGWKIGCTSKMAQEMSNTDEPFYGRMFAPTTYTSPCTVSMTDFMRPIVEPEIAFKLARDLTPDQGPYTAATVLNAIEALYPAIEVVDCRYTEGWPIGIKPTVADNGVHAAFVLGQAVSDWRSIDRPAISVSAQVNGKTVTEGKGANALADPLNALLWLVNKFHSLGRSLYQGEMITTGNTANAPIFAAAGDDNLVSFGVLGDVQIKFS